MHLLLENGADINTLAADGNTALHCVVLFRNGSVVRLRLANGAQVRAQILSRNTGIHCAACKSNNTVVELLLENKADTTTNNKKGGTPLRGATFSWGRLLGVVL